MTINRYIGRIDNSVSIDAIREHVTSNGVTVVDIEPVPQKHTRFKAFRLEVKKVDLKKIEIPAFWPEGVAIKPFFPPKNTIGADGVTASSSLASSNGNDSDVTPS